MVEEVSFLGNGNEAVMGVQKTRGGYFARGVDD
jgi:hypothetical protein